MTLLSHFFSRECQFYHSYHWFIPQENHSNSNAQTHARTQVLGIPSRISEREKFTTYVVMFERGVRHCVLHITRNQYRITNTNTGTFQDSRDEMDADQRRDACREHVSKGENTETCTLSSGSYDSSWSASSHIFLSRKYGCSGVQNQVRSHDAFGASIL